jgi:hypothetical protein
MDALIIHGFDVRNDEHLLHSVKIIHAGRSLAGTTVPVCYMATPTSRHTAQVHHGSGMLVAVEIPQAVQDQVSSELQAYVYMLVDPESGIPFYVGKGHVVTS